MNAGIADTRAFAVWVMAFEVQAIAAFNKMDCFVIKRLLFLQLVNDFGFV